MQYLRAVGNLYLAAQEVYDNRGQMIEDILEAELKPESMVTPSELAEYGDKQDELANPEAYKYFVPMQLKEGEDKDVIQFIEDDIEEIKKQYDAIGWEDLLERCKSNMDYIEGEQVVGGAVQKKLVLIATYAEIIAGRGKRQTMGARPIFQIERDDQMDKQEFEQLNARDIEDSLDYILRNKVIFESVIEQAYRLACGYPACVVKIPFIHSVTPPYKHVVKYGPENLADFEAKYAKDLASGKGKRFAQWEKLQAGEELYNEEDISKVSYHGGKVKIVDLENIYMRPSIKMVEDQPGIHERIPMQWSDIEANIRNGYYEKEAIVKMREYYEDPKIGKKLEDTEYTIWESTILYKTQRDKKMYRYKVTFDETSKVILKGVYFPYRICRPDYEVYNAWPKHNSWIGYSSEEKLCDIVGMVNSLVNSIFNELGIAHNRILMTDDPGFSEESQRRTVSIDDGMLTVIPFSKGSQFKDFPFDYSPTDRQPMLQWAVNMSELISGVSASLMSGQETPGDANAPYAKAALKFKSSNIRIEDIIISLQKTDERVAEQVAMIEYQFPRNQKDAKPEEQVIAQAILDQRIRYVCQGSSMAFDKVYDNQIMFASMELLKANYPEIFEQNKYDILKVILDNSQGSIERIKDKIMDTVRMVLDSRKELEEAFKNMPPEQQTAIKRQLAGGEGIIGGGQPQGPQGAQQRPPVGATAPVKTVRQPVGPGMV